MQKLAAELWYFHMYAVQFVLIIYIYCSLECILAVIEAS